MSAVAPVWAMDLRPSRRLLRWLALGHALAWLAPWLSAQPPWLTLAANGVVAVSAVWQWHRWRQGARRLYWRADGTLRLELASGRVLEGKVQAGWVLPGLITLEVLPDGGGCFPLLLLADSASAEALRQLRVLLRRPPRPQALR